MRHVTCVRKLDEIYAKAKRNEGTVLAKTLNPKNTWACREGTDLGACGHSPK